MGGLWRSLGRSSFIGLLLIGTVSSSISDSGTFKGPFSMREACLYGKSGPCPSTLTWHLNAMPTSTRQNPDSSSFSATSSEYSRSPKARSDSTTHSGFLQNRNKVNTGRLFLWTFFLALIAFSMICICCTHDAVRRRYCRRLRRVEQEAQEQNYSTLKTWRKKYINFATIGLLLYLTPVCYVYMIAYLWLGILYCLSRRRQKDKKKKKRDLEEGVVKVTRSLVDNFVPNYTSTYALKFDFLDPEKSFSKRLRYCDINKEVANDDDGEISETSDNLCLICLDTFEDNDDLLLFPCGHYSHYECLLLYSQSQSRETGDNAWKSTMRCLYCQLNLLRFYLFYIENELDPSVTKFFNKK